MAISTLDGLLEYVRPAQFFLQGNYGLDAETAADVVQDVLLRLFQTRPIVKTEDVTLKTMLSDLVARGDLQEKRGKVSRCFVGDSQMG